MSKTIDLKKLEQQAFRATHQDGLWDIYIGGVVLSMSFLSQSEEVSSAQFIGFLVGLAASYLIFWAGKKYLVAPRLGQVKFGPQRQRQKKILALVMTGIVGVQVLVLTGTLYLWGNPQVASSLGLAGGDQNRERLIISFLGALFVGPSMALIAYFNDFPRGYYMALVLSLAVFSLIWFSQPWYMVAAALLILIPGAVLFVRFLRRYPLPAKGGRRD